MSPSIQAGFDYFLENLWPFILPEIAAFVFGFFLSKSWLDFKHPSKRDARLKSIWHGFIGVVIYSTVVAFVCVVKGSDMVLKANIKTISDIRTEINHLKLIQEATTNKKGIREKLAKFYDQAIVFHRLLRNPSTPTLQTEILNWNAMVTAYLTKTFDSSYAKEFN